MQNNQLMHKDATPNLGTYFNNINFSDFSCSNTVQSQAMRNYISDTTPKGSWLLTLTFHGKVRSEKANKSLRTFDCRLNKEIYGHNRSTRQANPAKVSFISATEHGSNNTLHFHLILHPLGYANDVRSNENGTPIDIKSVDSLLPLIKKAWNLAGGSTQQIDLREVHDAEGIAKYLTKEVWGDKEVISFDFCRHNLSKTTYKAADQNFKSWIKNGSKAKLT